jgi:urease accessory protein
MSRRLSTIPLSLAIALIAAPAFAHTGAGGLLGGFGAGFTHPLFGVDHLLAMLAVGMWGAQLGGRAVWVLPVAFPMVMALGGAAAILGIPLAHVEIGIAGSVVVLGLAVALAAKPSVWTGAVIVGALALFHGHAHGTELPGAVDPFAYGIGFVVATGLIHAAGIGIGEITRLPRGQAALRAVGGAVCAAGVVLLAGPLLP